MASGRSEILYFIKLPNKFLNGDVIRWVENQERGAEIVLFFFRLLLIAKNRDGKLVRIVGKKETPFSINEIAIETYKDIDFAKRALEVLKEAELVEDKEIYLFVPKALEFTNQTTRGAEYQKEYRARNKDCDICNTDIDKEQEEIKKSLDKEREKYEKEVDNFPYAEVIEHFNKVIGSKYKSNSKEIIRLIKQRIREGFNKEDFISVINKKYNDWRDTKYACFLRPKTLFGDKFESYVNQEKCIYDDFQIDSDTNEFIEKD